MKNLKVGPNACTSLVAQDIAEVFTADNCSRVYQTDGQYKSWEPGRDINPFNTLEVGVGYIAIMKEITDVTDIFSEGIAGGGLSGLFFVNLSGRDFSFHWKNVSNANVGTLQTINAGNTLAILQTSDMPAGAVSIAWTDDLTPYSLGVTGYNKTASAFDSGVVLKHADNNIYPVVDVAGNLAGDEAIIYTIGQPLTKVQINCFSNQPSGPNPVIFTPPNSTPFANQIQSGNTESYYIKDLPANQVGPGATLELTNGTAFKVDFMPEGQGGSRSNIAAGDHFTFDMTAAIANDIIIDVYQDVPDHYVEISNYSTHQWAINNSDGGATLQLLEAGAKASFTQSQLFTAGVSSGLTLVATDGTSFTSLMQRPNADPYINDTITTNFSFSIVQSTHSLDDGDIKLQLLDR